MNQKGRSRGQVKRGGGVFVTLTGLLLALLGNRARCAARALLCGLFFRLAFHDLEEGLPVERLVFEERLRDCLQLVGILGEDLAGALVRCADDAPHLGVNLLGNRLTVVTLLADLAA